MAFARYRHADVRSELLGRREIALLDVREESVHAQAHPLFAASFPRGRIELDAYARLPRRTVPIALIDDGDGEAEIAARRLRDLGFANVGLLDGGIEGWRSDGGELFRDVNVPSKAFGEMVEATRHTPSISPQEVSALIDDGADVVVVDARRFDEYRTMSVPTGISVPGAELVLRVPALVAGPKTRVIVNCAGRTRSIIGTQSLINAGLPNPVAALRNGTIGWTLAGLALEHGQTRRGDRAIEGAARLRFAEAARRVAKRAGVQRATRIRLDAWLGDAARTTYRFDVRSPDEYEAGHLPGFCCYPGGQLVQETEVAAPVRGARIVLVDDDGVRANMTGSWLAQMAWDVYVLDDVSPTHFKTRGAWTRPLPPLPEVQTISPAALHECAGGPVAPVVIDIATSTEYRRGHVPGAWFALRSRLADAMSRIPVASRYVIVCGDGVLSTFAAAEAAEAAPGRVVALRGGTQAWTNARLPLQREGGRFASLAIDRYRRPYEGADNAPDAMRAYLEWEFGLVTQLARDGTHGFRVI